MTVSVSCSRECGCARTRKSLSESAVYSGGAGLSSFPKNAKWGGVWSGVPILGGKWKDTFSTPFGVIPTSFGVIWNGVLWTFGV